MDNKHTPGPWIVISNEDEGGYDVVKPDGLPGKMVVAHDICQGKDDGESDAKLIAAAPEMLEALIRAKGTMERDKNCGFRLDYKGKPAHEVGSTYLKVCEAIKKATS